MHINLHFVENQFSRKCFSHVQWGGDPNACAQAEKELIEQIWNWKERILQPRFVADFTNSDNDSSMPALDFCERLVCETGLSLEVLVKMTL